MKTLWITVPLASLALSALSFSVARAETDGDEAGEQSMTMKQTPRAVRYTLLREADGVDIASVDKEAAKGGASVYEADVVIDGTNYEIRVDATGKLLSKAIDNEDDEAAGKADGDKGKKGEEADEDAKSSKGEADEADEKPAKAHKAAKSDEADEADESDAKSSKGEADEADEKPAKAHKSDEADEAEDSDGKPAAKVDADESDEKPAAKAHKAAKSEDSEQESGDKD